MSTTDISRSIFEPKKHYSSVGMQMGKVVTDDEWNEGQAVHGEDRRRSLVHVIGPAGSPDTGFQIATPILDGGEIEFDILPGTFYLGGMRIELEEGETFRTQRDWLQQTGSAPTPPTGARYDLVYLQAWQQGVQAAEDAELFEVALGTDTGTRLRTMRRVRVRTDVKGPDCPNAWADVLADWSAWGYGALSDENELVPDSTLTVTFDPGGDPEDLCTPLVAGGYLGAENQSIRVQIVDSNELTWGFDNASSLYRVTLAADRKTVTLLTEPRDQAHWPLSGQTVEILGWSAVLPNGEKLAQSRGHLSTVDASYNPDSGELTLQDAVPSGFAEAWKDRPDETDLAAPSTYLFMRVWNRGSDRTSPATIGYTVGNPVTLGNTGLRVTIDGADLRPGDYWIIAARPETPNRVVPWELERGRAPHGARRFYAPLALIRWTKVGNTITGTVVDDCRETFRPLTRQQTCCRYRVGDGVISHGDFTSIQDAVDHLPPAGGEVCVLPGEYREHVTLSGLTDVTVHGCGGKSRVMAKPRASGATGPAPPVFLVENCRNVAIRSLAIGSAEGPAIELVEDTSIDDQAVLERISLADLTLGGRDRSVVFGSGGRFIELEDSTVEVTALAANLDAKSDVGKWPAVYLAADDVTIEGDRILAAASTGFLRTPMGGIQIGGGSERVELRRNHIEGGTGHGITLGSVVYVTEKTLELAEADYKEYAAGYVKHETGEGLAIGSAGCIEVSEDPPVWIDEGGNELVPASEGALDEVRIIDNRIRGMGSNGIGVARFFDLDARPELITVDHLTVELNDIQGCLQLSPPTSSAARRRYLGYGGVALADGERMVFRDNLIRGNGVSHLDPVCGIFVLHGEGVVIENNRILENSPPDDEAEGTPRPGHRGGIVIAHARPPVMTVDSEYGQEPRQNGFPAVRIHDNIVVQPLGRAIRVTALGPVSVHGNQLTSRGLIVPNIIEALFGSSMGGGLGGGIEEDEEDEDLSRSETLLELLAGSVVTILDLGIAREAAMTDSTPSFLGYLAPFVLGDRFGATTYPSLTKRGEPSVALRSILANGNVLFNDNQVVLDLLAAGTSVSLCSVLLATLDDLSMHGNQLDCDLSDDFVLANAVAIGWSVRVADNRFKEDVRRAYLSAATVAALNSTTDNQGTHCIWATGSPNVTVDQPNRCFLEIDDPSACGRT